MDRVSCTLFLSHRQARWLAGLGALDLLFCFIFITLPDNRDSDYPNSELIFGVQMAGAWLNLALTVGCLVLQLRGGAVPTSDRAAVRYVVENTPLCALRARPPQLLNWT
jgi:hypothetical protein